MSHRTSSPGSRLATTHFWTGISKTLQSPLRVLYLVALAYLFIAYAKAPLVRLFARPPRRQHSLPVGPPLARGVYLRRGLRADRGQPAVGPEPDGRPAAAVAHRNPARADACRWGLRCRWCGSPAANHAARSGSLNSSDWAERLEAVAARRARRLRRATSPARWWHGHGPAPARCPRCAWRAQCRRTHRRPSANP